MIQTHTFMSPVIPEEARKAKQKRSFDLLLNHQKFTSQNKLAESAGLPRRTVCDLCNGTTDYAGVKHSTVIAIAKALGMSVDELDKFILG